MKLDAAGSALDYSTFLGGNNFDIAFGIAVDSSGNAYMTGGTDSSNFPTTGGAFQENFGGSSGGGLRGDAFVTKINPAGSDLVYSTFLGSSGSEEGHGIAVDSAGNAYVVGYTTSTDNPLTLLQNEGFPLANPLPQDFFNGVNVGFSGDAFVTKLNAAGSNLVYSTYLGGSGTEGAFSFGRLGAGIAVDASGNAYVTGDTLSTNFPTADPFQPAHGGPAFGSDAFVAKLNSAGSALTYSSYLGGSGGDAGRGIAVDLSGNAYVTGLTFSTNFPTTEGAFQVTFAGPTMNGFPVGPDAFVAKIGEEAPATTCTFTTVGTTMTLDGDCTTDATILVPNGFTLDGAGHTITAVDPAGGHFLGPVVRNAGATAHVTNLTVTTSNLSNVCDDGANRLRGIMFEGASGTIAHNQVLNINQGASGCQEGNAIEVRNAPFDAGGTDVLVWISGNTVTNYQKTGIVANGSVAATIIGNVVMGAGPINYIAQNGIQIGFGGTAIVKENDISGNYYTPKSFVSCGLLMFDSDGVRASQNHYANNERNVCVFGRGGGKFNPEP